MKLYSYAKVNLDLNVLGKTGNFDSIAEFDSANKSSSSAQIKLDAELKSEFKRAYQTYVTEERVTDNSDGSFNSEQGYHLLDSFFSYIDLYDEIEITKNNHKQHKIIANYDLSKLDNSNADQSAPDQSGLDNLIIKAIKLFHSYYKIIKPSYFTIRHHKNIPIKAGLGGGSSNAAVILNYLYNFYHIEESLTNKILLAKTLGADVAFFMSNKSRYITSIGDKFGPTITYPQLPILIIKPKQGLDTKQVFKNLDLNIINNKQKDKILRPQKENYNIEEFWHFLQNSYNDLTQPACLLCPEIKKILNFSSSNPQLEFITKMTGSGSTCIMIFKNHTNLEKLYPIIEKQFFYIYKSKLLCNSKYL